MKKVFVGVLFSFLMLFVGSANAQEFPASFGLTTAMSMETNETSVGATYQFQINDGNKGIQFRTLIATSNDDYKLRSPNRVVADYTQYDLMVGPVYKFVEDDQGNFMTVSGNVGLSVSSLNQVDFTTTPQLERLEDSAVSPVFGLGIGIHSDVFVDFGVNYVVEKTFFDGDVVQDGHVAPFITVGISY